MICRKQQYQVAGFCQQSIFQLFDGNYFSVGRNILCLFLNCVSAIKHPILCCCLWMTNLTPSPVDCLNLTSRALMSEALLALYSASNVTNFLESSFNINSEVGCPAWKYRTTNDTSHTCWYLGAGGVRWTSPATNEKQLDVAQPVSHQCGEEWLKELIDMNWG